jgi:hypothetical protein
MKAFNFTMVLVWISMAALGVEATLAFGEPSISTFANYLRLPLFTGLMALAGFLFTSRATWLGRLRESYEAAEHVENVQELRRRGKTVQFYGGFGRLASALNTLTFIICLSGAVQLTVGFVQSQIAAGACVGAATGAAVLFLYFLYRIRRVESFWVKKLEADQEAKQRSEGSSSGNHVAAALHL